MPEPDFLQPSGRALLKPLRRIAALVLWLIADPASASFGGRLELGFGVAFAAAAVLALPGALLCALAEWLGNRHRPPLWVGFIALASAIYCMSRALRLVGSDGESVLFLFPVPPLMTLALVALLPAPAWRSIAVWCVAAGGVGLALLRGWQLGPSSTMPEGLGALLGGAVVSTLLWQSAFLFGQRSLRRAGMSPAPAPDRRRLLSQAADILKQATANRPRWGASVARQPGFIWWLGGAGAYFVGIAALTALDYNVLLLAMLHIEWQVIDFLGFAVRGPESISVRVWAVHGLVWSAIAGGGSWGAAATAGRFDAGRLAPLRLAAMLLAIVMLVWVASVASAANY